MAYRICLAAHAVTERGLAMVAGQHSGAQAVARLSQRTLAMAGPWMGVAGRIAVAAAAGCLRARLRMGRPALFIAARAVAAASIDSGAAPAPAVAMARSQHGSCAMGRFAPRHAALAATIAALNPCVFVLSCTIACRTVSGFWYQTLLRCSARLFAAGLKADCPRWLAGQWMKLCKVPLS